MDLNIAEHNAKQLIAQHLPSDWKFKWSQAHTILGQCRYSTKTIFLSRSITLINSEQEVMDTIKHEICHALVGPGFGHGTEWKRACIKIGCKPQSTGPIEAETVEQRKQVGAKWLLVDESGKIWRHWVRKPAQKTFDTIKFAYMPGHRSETEGKLRIIPA